MPAPEMTREYLPAAPKVEMVARDHRRKSRGAGLFHGEVRRPPGSKVPQSAVAVDRARRRGLAHDGHVRVRVQISVAQESQVARRLPRTVTEHAANIRTHKKLGHQPRPVPGHIHPSIHLEHELAHALRHHPHEFRGNDVHAITLLGPEST